MVLNAGIAWFCSKGAAKDRIGMKIARRKGPVAHLPVVWHFTEPAAASAKFWRLSTCWGHIIVGLGPKRQSILRAYGISRAKSC